MAGDGAGGQGSTKHQQESKAELIGPSQGAFPQQCWNNKCHFWRVSLGFQEGQEKASSGIQLLLVWPPSELSAANYVLLNQICLSLKIAPY